ncbi:probable chitinase 10 [Calliphora vicina]|uniref:probable chitinase 10 n=1 Tax=Calliphora vicina TaxID=7373 RepID=UPI00325A4547
MKIFILTLLAALNGLTLATLDLAQHCLDKNVGEVVSHPNDCRGYIVCDVEPTVYYCEASFHFDAERRVCNWPENANCQLATQPIDDVPATVERQHSSLMAMDVATGEIVDPLTGYQPENVICRHFGAYFLPNPKQCRTYYLCAYGHMHEHSCGAGTLWNYRSQQCVLNYKADCYQQTAEETKEISDSLANSMDNPLLVCYPVGSTLGAQTNVSTTPTPPYTTRPQPAVTPTHSSKTPSLPYPTRPQPIVTPTHSSIRPSSTSLPYPTTTTQSPKRPNPSNPYGIECPPKRQSYVAHPKDCGKYFMCIVGTPVLTSCPFGLYWDSKKEYCDLAQNVKCFE